MSARVPPDDMTAQMRNLVTARGHREDVLVERYLLWAADEIDRLRGECQRLREGGAQLAVERDELRRWQQEACDLLATRTRPPMDERYPLNEPCEYCGDRVVDHSPSELRSCVIDLEAREQGADVLAWWRSQQ